MKELIARMRTYLPLGDGSHWAQVSIDIRDAANALEAQQAEISRLQGEVANRNSRALEGDKAIALRDSLIDGLEGLEKERDALAEQVKVLRGAANVVVATHDDLIPILNAYMRSLGMVQAWERTCVASDQLREALATGDWK